MGAAGLESSGPGHVRAARQALLWLLRSIYVGRLALCYFIMIRGRHAEPDLVFLAFTAALFVNLVVFLAAFFEYFNLGRRAVLADALLRPLALAALVAWGLAAGRPTASLGWSGGGIAGILLLAEFLFLPALILRLRRAIGSHGKSPAADSD